MSRIALRQIVISVIAAMVLAPLGARAVSAQSAPTQSTHPGIHVVQSGETLAAIAQAYNLSPARLAEVNGISSPAQVSAGTRLLIPPSVETWASESGTPVVVGFDDSFGTLAAQFHVTPYDIGVTNKIIREDLVVVGDSVLIPGAFQDQAKASVARLTAGTPLWRVALRTGSNMAALAIDNDLGDLSNVLPDIVINVPGDAHDSLGLMPPWVAIKLHTLPLEAGRTGGITISVDSPGIVSGKFLSHDLQFVQEGTIFWALFGVDRWTKAGVYPLSITFTAADGKVSSIERNVRVIRGNYAREVVVLPEDAAAARSDPQIVAAELAYLTQKMSGFTPVHYWSGLFGLPTPGVLTSAFGSVRSINNSGYDSYHTGNDLATATGTPILAPANGVVVDTGFLDIRGFSTIINHGGGVYTGYWHQSSILVHPGDTVAAGQKIGTVGDTGSSTASHLHWEMWVGGVPVDALQWVREVFP